MNILNNMIASVAIFSLILAGCSSTTQLRTEDPTVKVYADGQYVGQGGGSYTDSKIAGSHTEIELQKEGCAPEYRIISKDGGLHVGALIGGLFVLVPFLWIVKYKDFYRFDYVCQNVSA